jgi:iron donor protein CyaY
MDDQQFRNRADEALEDLNSALIVAADAHGFDVDFQNGALTVEFEEPPAKFIVSPNAPVKQIWLSALSRSFKFSWDEEAQAFVYPETNETLHTVLAKVISTHLDTDVFV